MSEALKTAITAMDLAWEAKQAAESAHLLASKADDAATNIVIALLVERGGEFEHNGKLYVVTPNRFRPGEYTLDMFDT